MIIQFFDKLKTKWQSVGTDNPLPISLEGSKAIQPVDVQARLASTIQTHNAVSIAGGATSAGSWIDCDGFTEIGITFKNDAVTNAIVDIDWSHDGVTQQGRDINSPLPAGTGIVRATSISTKARYARLAIYNGDGAVAHTMSAWVYLKA